jgi:hypothetical protein
MMGREGAEGSADRTCCAATACPKRWRSGLVPAQLLPIKTMVEPATRRLCGVILCERAPPAWQVTVEGSRPYAQAPGDLRAERDRLTADLAEARKGWLERLLEATRRR